MDAFAQVAGTPLGGSTPPIDMSVYGLFMQADWVVKAVMIALLLASFWSWAIIFEKMLRLRSLKKSAQSFEDTFWSGVSLEDLYDRVGAKPDDPMSSIFAAAMREWRRSVSKGLATSATARAAPVGAGTMFSAAARASRRSLVATSSRRCELVYEWTVVRKPF